MTLAFDLLLKQYLFISMPLTLMTYLAGFVPFVIALFGWSTIYIAVNYHLELEAQKQRAIKAESLAHAARLQALRNQLEPHFIFNTLNAISTLVVERKNDAATHMIHGLGKFLRMTLDRTENPEITVAEELEFVRTYVQIQECRFGDRLKVSIQATPAAMQALVPALILQPLVENSIKHGVLTRETAGFVTIDIRVAGESLGMSVTDDGPGPVNRSPAHGVGLANTQARLTELYGDAARFSSGAIPGGGYGVMIEIPVRIEQ